MCDRPGPCPWQPRPAESAFYMNSPPMRHSRTALPRSRLVLETCLMIVFITRALWYTGRVESPLLNLSLLVIVAGAIGQ